MIQKKFSRSLGRQPSETKPRAKIVLVRREPLLYLEFNKPNKSTFPSVKTAVDTLIDVRNETSKQHFLKSDKINT